MQPFLWQLFHFSQIYFLCFVSFKTISCWRGRKLHYTFYLLYLSTFFRELSNPENLPASYNLAIIHILGHGWSFKTQLTTYLLLRQAGSQAAQLGISWTFRCSRYTPTKNLVEVAWTLTGWLAAQDNWVLHFSSSGNDWGNPHALTSVFVSF